MLIMAINADEESAFDQAEALCDQQYPACGCAAQGVDVEDGALITGRWQDQVQAACDGGACMAHTVGTGGSGGAGTGGGGGAGAPAATCPMSPPATGAPCSAPTRSCFYDACPAGPRALSVCSGDSWTTQTGSSCDLSCGTLMCNPGEICLVLAGGSLSYNCMPNGCGTGPVAELCAGGCPIVYSLEGGVQVSCNTCPQGGCP